jgi:hypothetical protein
MRFHMRTTLVIDDELFRDLKRRAAAESRTLSEVTQEALRRGLARPRRPRRSGRVKLPSFGMGSPRVDLADRNQLFEVLDRS